MTVAIQPMMGKPGAVTFGSVKQGDSVKRMVWIFPVSMESLLSLMPTSTTRVMVPMTRQLLLGSTTAKGNGDTATNVASWFSMETRNRVHVLQVVLTNLLALPITDSLLTMTSSLVRMGG